MRNGAAPDRLASLNTEAASLRFRGLETWSDSDVLAALWESQADAAASVRAALPAVAAAAAASHARLQHRGRLVYVGAGTSGRLAFQDGAELGPTFDWPDERLVLVIAGGAEALRRGLEGAEDDFSAGEAVAERDTIGHDDVVVAVAASGRTPFTVGCLAACGRRGALTIAVANADGPLLAAAQYPILAQTGAEVLAGSTRLKAGTAQKMILNLFSTLLMTRLGRVHDGRMIDMRASNSKLQQRAMMMVCDFAGCDQATAVAALAATQGRIKPAVLVARGLAPVTASEVLRRHGSHLRLALAEIGA